eukprot:2259472-Amphidinium_carterae.2
MMVISMRFKERRWICIQISDRLQTMYQRKGKGQPPNWLLIRMIANNSKKHTHQRQRSSCYGND